MSCSRRMRSEVSWPGCSCHTTPHSDGSRSASGLTNTGRPSVAPTPTSYTATTQPKQPRNDAGRQRRVASGSDQREQAERQRALVQLRVVADSKLVQGVEQCLECHALGVERQLVLC